MSAVSTSSLQCKLYITLRGGKVIVIDEYNTFIYYMHSLTLYVINS